MSKDLERLPLYETFNLGNLDTMSGFAIDERPITSDELIQEVASIDLAAMSIMRYRGARFPAYSGVNSTRARLGSDIMLENYQWGLRDDERAFDTCIGSLPGLRFDAHIEGREHKFANPNGPRQYSRWAYLGCYGPDGLLLNLNSITYNKERNPVENVGMTTAGGNTVVATNQQMRAFKTIVATTIRQALEEVATSQIEQT